MAWSSRVLPNIFLYYIFVILINHGNTTTEVCKNHSYTVINDTRRSTSNVFNATRGDALLCDRGEIKESLWYRFELADGNKLATSRPESHQCGTFSPIWMNGSHPSVVDGEVQRKACAYVPVAFPFGCAYAYNIKVLNCGSFYVYQLKPPRHCFLAYCVGKQSLVCHTL
jgi:hypothetical protein